MKNEMTLDYLLCKKHLDQLTKRKGNEWVTDHLEGENKGYSEYFPTDKCERMYGGKICNKKGVVITKYKMADPHSEKKLLVDVTHVFGVK